MYLGHAPGLGSNAQLAQCKGQNKISVSRAQQGHTDQDYCPCSRVGTRPPAANLLAQGCAGGKRDVPQTPSCTQRTASLATLPAFSYLFCLPLSLSSKFLLKNPQPLFELGGLFAAGATHMPLNLQPVLCRVGRSLLPLRNAM